MRRESTTIRHMLIEGKKLLITGVLNPDSIAFAVAREAQANGAEILLTSFGRVRSITEKTAKRLPKPVEVLELDVNKPEDIDNVRERLAQRWGRVDGVLHAIAYAPPDALGGNFLATPYESAATAFQTSAYSFKSIVVGLLPLLEGHDGSAVTLDFDNSHVAWPAYDWMGVAKAALESVTRYLARDLGPKRVRVNAVSAGFVRTMAAKGIPGSKIFGELFSTRAPLGWDPTDATPVAQAVLFLFSDWSRGITGEIIHVDGGFHAMGAQMYSPAEQQAGE